jgi:Cd2+/Zn2+-exporting ATPase
MDCAEEVSLLRRELGRMPGIVELNFDVVKAKMAVEFDAGQVDAAQISKAVARTGMRAEPFREVQIQQPWWRENGRGVLTAVSGLALVLGSLAQAGSPGEFLRSLAAHEHGEAMKPAAILFYVVAVLCGMYYAAPKAWSALRRGNAEMNVLVTVSILGAMVLGEWGEGGTLAFLFALAGLLESWSMGRARKAVSSLMAVAPTEATVIHSHGEHRVAVDKVKTGERVRIKAGERIPCDGEVMLGTSFVNQALITGESIPVAKQPGSTVYAGAINGDGLLEVRVSKPPSDTLLARMVRMLEGAQHRRAPSEQFVERFSRVYTPAMFVLAALVAAVPPLMMGGNWAESAYQGMVILLISCPCALVISTPVTVVAALASAARSGVLIKGGAFLEEAAKVRAVAFDKTGVLTRGQPEVRSFVPVVGLSEDQALTRLLALERRSEHPIGHAIVRYAEGRGITPADVTSFHSVTGRGAEAVIEGERFWAGSHRFVHEKGLEHDELCEHVNTLEDAGHTAFLCGTDRMVWAAVSMADPLRDEAAEAVRALRRAGVGRLVMLTGDNGVTASAVGRELALDDVRADLLPDEKARRVQELRHEFAHIAMVGDGINDAQALAVANLGVAMGRRSTDVALETADVVLMNDDLRNLGFLLRHSRRAAAIIKQNVALAIGLKAAFLVMAFAGMATLWMAIAADMGATLMVTFNGLRMLRATR